MILLIGALMGGYMGVAAANEGAKSGSAVPSNMVSRLQRWFGETVEELKRDLITPDYPRLASINLDVKFDDFELIRAKRDEALATSILMTSDDDLVPATITIDGNRLDAKIRLKGDWADHLKTDKWSFRIEMKGDDRAFGMRKFSIQSPHTKAFHFEQIYFANLRSEGILAPRYEFVDVTLNGEKLGIYALEEFFTKELIESQGKRSGVILGFEEQYFWEHISQNPRPPDAFGMLTWSFRSSNAYIDIFDQGRISKDTELQAQADRAVSNLRKFQAGEVTASEIFDLEQMGTFLAVVELWQAHHSLLDNNFRLYFNPVSGLLEPVGFDGDTDQAPTDTEQVFNVYGRPDLFAAILDDPIASAHFVRELGRVSSEQYLDEIQKRFAQTSTESRKRLLVEYPAVKRLWPKIEARQKVLRKLINPSIAGIAYGSLSENSGAPFSVILNIANPLAVSVDVVGIRVEPIVSEDGESREAIDIILPDSGSGFTVIPRRDFVTDPLDFRTINVELPAVAHDLISKNAELTVKLQVLGQDTIRTSPVIFVRESLTILKKSPGEVVLAEVLAEHPFLQLSDPKTISINGGVWNVKTDLVVPSGYVLIVNAGTTLRFGEGVKLISDSAVHLHGEERAPIELDSIGSSWGGIYVQRADDASIWRYARVKNTSVTPEPGRSITGGVTFNESPLTLRNVTFEGSDAEDMLNVVLAGINFRNVVFSGARSDGFDGDAVIGKIEQANFINIGGDGLDISSSDIVGSEMTFTQIGDKAISVGESSKAQFTDIKITGAGFGIASKDLSFVTVEGVEFEVITHFSLASYQKKPEYGPAVLDVTDFDYDLGRVVADEQSELIINSQTQTSTPENIEELFTAAIDAP